MNQLRFCFCCWIPPSKTKTDGLAVKDTDETEIPNPYRSLISSSHFAPPSHPFMTRHPSSATTSSVDDLNLVTAEESSGNGAGEAENYIALEKCFSVSRSSKIQAMPIKLVQRDIHLLDLVPPSPCSLMENPGSLSGMSEVYAPTSPRKISSRTPRGSLGCFGARVVDSPSKIQQMTPQGRRRELFNFEVKTLESRTESNHPPPPPPPPQSIEYLQLDLDQPIHGSRGSPNAIHRALNSTSVDYVKIDPFRTKALSEVKRQLETNRQNGKISLKTVNL